MAQQVAPAPRPGAAAPWAVTKIIWEVLVAALIPISLCELIAKLPKIFARLRRFESVVGAHARRQMRDYERAAQVKKAA